MQNDTFEILRNGVYSLGLELSPVQEKQIRDYHKGLAKWNHYVNLTSSNALTDSYRIHFLDSLTIVPLLRKELGEAFWMIDVGTGGGFPGLPTKLFLPKTRLTLVEVTVKKAAFLGWLIETLDLQRVEVIAQRAEALAHGEDYRGAFDAVVARALGTFATTLELTLPFCKIGGLVVAMRAGNVLGDVARAVGVAEKLGGHVRPLIPVAIPGLREDAVLVVVDKVNPTPNQYPRRIGVPAHRPLAGSATSILGE